MADMPDTTYDPLAGRRAPGGAEFDVFLWGTVFLDIIFTGLPDRPADGTEVWAEGMGSSPGGTANLAIAASRLGLRTSLAAAFGDDDYADFCWRTLSQQEHVDLGPVPEVRQLALACHCLGGVRRRPQHGDPRPPVTGLGHRDDRPATTEPSCDCRPRGRRHTG
ncbi:hypothetical protein [Kribbella qitaiheensis]|uniref:hypothetical protein n=1 Tax=Kribbella qitaiheensis TaxID=1544730 RepID=UPI001FE505E5|nr:hypothetical protein [Kribbella qitaiheensis]